MASPRVGCLGEKKNVVTQTDRQKQWVGLAWVCATLLTTHTHAHSTTTTTTSPAASTTHHYYNHHPVEPSSSSSSTITTITHHHYQQDAPHTTTTMHHNHPESAEDQAAVLAAKRAECEVWVREEASGTPLRDSTLDDASPPPPSPPQPRHDSGSNTGDAWEAWSGRQDVDWVSEGRENATGVSHCPTTFDDIYCWPRTPPDTLITIPCPSYVKNFMSGSNATRYCTSQGTWFRQEGGNSSWSNYSQCSTTVAVIHHDYPDIEKWVSLVRAVSLVGYSVSLVTLLVAFTVLACIKRLRCPRNTLHMHLFLSFICRAVGALARGTDAHGLLPEEPSMHGGTWGCRLFTTLWQYFILANYAWILMEGLYLHNLIFLALFTDNSAIALYIWLGWEEILCCNSGDAKKNVVRSREEIAAILGLYHSMPLQGTMVTRLHTRELQDLTIRKER